MRVEDAETAEAVAAAAAAVYAAEGMYTAALQGCCHALLDPNQVD